MLQSVSTSQTSLSLVDFLIYNYLILFIMTNNPSHLYCLLNGKNKDNLKATRCPYEVMLKRNTIESIEEIFKEISLSSKS